MDRSTRMAESAALLPESFNDFSHLLVSSIRVILMLPFILLTGLTSFFMYAISWIAWFLRLVLTITFRMLKILYVTYQLLMMVLNITCTLLILKTSSIVRHEMKSKSTKSQLKKNEALTNKRNMKEWIKELDATSSFDDFLGMTIEEPTDVALGAKSIKKPHTKARRCTSFEGGLTTMDPKEFQRSVEDDPTLEENDDESGLGTVGPSLINITKRLKELRKKASETEDSKIDHDCDDVASLLKSSLSDVVKRNHLSINDLLKEDARSVAESGRHKLNAESRSVIYEFNVEVERCLNCLAESSCLNTNDSTDSPSSTEAKDPNEETSQSRDILRKEFVELNDRVALIRRLKQDLGNTGLLLSGGGSLAMYHTGLLRALIEADLYDDIPVITGASGGSIVAGFCAILRPNELLTKFCVNTCSTDYGGNGQMKRDNIRWFPPPVEMIKNFFEHNALVDPAEFKKCSNFYYGDMTFEEAFKHTKKHVCITVSASRSNIASGSGAQRLLLNHISTPHVTIASAVVASCALPGVMAPANLYTKNKYGNLELFEEDGLEWVDGSIQADLPFQRIAMLFNVSNYIVCQTNPHVVPFMHKAHHPGMNSFHWKLLKTCEGDIRSRMTHMSQLDLLPKLAGQDISAVFGQKYDGDLTIVPRFPTTHMLGLTVLANPTVEHMNIYIQRGQGATWPFVRAMREMVRQERALKNVLSSLQERIRSLGSEFGFHLMIDTGRNSLSSSLASTGNRAYFLTNDNEEHEILEKRIESLEEENAMLRTKLEQVDRVMGVRRSIMGRDSISGLPVDFVDYESEDEIVPLDQKKSTLRKRKNKRMTVF